MAPPGGETANDFAHRVAGALQSIQAEYNGRSVVVGAHAGTNRGLLAAILGRQAAYQNKEVTWEEMLKSNERWEEKSLKLAW